MTEMEENSDDAVLWHLGEANISKMRSSVMNMPKNNKEQAARFVDVEVRDEYWENTWMMGINHPDFKN